MAIENRARALAIILGYEGGDVDDKRDRGGATRRGISLGFLRLIGLDVNGDGVVNKKDVFALSMGQIWALYREHFWDKMRCDELPAGVDLICFGAAVNQGPRRATKFLQRALRRRGARIKADGIMGPRTIRASAVFASPALLIEGIAVARQLHYTSIAGWLIYRKGWTRRLMNVYRKSLELAWRRP
jgi:lysozyme family protein